MSTGFKLRRLHPFLAVYDSGSTSAATDIAHMTQPAVAAAVAAIEQDIGQALFRRHSRGMSPTTAGEVFARRARAAVAHLQQAENWLRQNGGTSGLPLHRHVSEVQLNTLSTVIAAGNFSAAARTLGLAQPSLYRAASELETLCGVSLWRRKGRGIEASAAAFELARRAALCFGELDAGLQELRELEGRTDGVVRVGTLPLASAQWLPRAMTATLSTWPDARFQVFDGAYEAQIAALRSGRIDFLLGTLRDPLPYDDLEQVHVFDDPHIIVVRQDHPHASGFDSDHDKLSPEQLGALDWILPRQGTPGRQTFESFMANKGLPPPSRVIECGLVATTRALLLSSDRAAILSRQQVGPEIDMGLLKIMGPPLTGSNRPIGITLRSGYRLPGLQSDLYRHLKDFAT